MRGTTVPFCFQKNKDFSNALQDIILCSRKGTETGITKATGSGEDFLFELKDFASSKKYFEALLSNGVNQDVLQLEALRGLVRVIIS